MKKHAIAGALFTTAFTLSADAQAPRFLTSWYFRVDYIASSKYIESTDSTANGPILLPTGARWGCDRKAASLTPSGAVVAGFACYNSAGYVSVQAVCAGTDADEDRARATLGDSASSAFILTARCRTAPITPPAVARPDKSL